MLRVNIRMSPLLCRAIHLQSCIMNLRGLPQIHTLKHLIIVHWELIVILTLSAQKTEVGPFF